MRIGVDLGGTKIEAIALDGAGTEIARQRIATPQGDYAATLQASTNLIQSIERETGQHGSVGVGIPGAMSPKSGLVKNANSTCLIGHPFDKDLSAALERPVRVANDANCFTLSEATDGAAAGASAVFGVILGTGVGGGLIHNGELIVGQNLIAGEWGHNPLPWATPDELPGALCYCGQRGCIETYLNGAGLMRAYADHEGTNSTAKAAEVVEKANAGDASAKAALAAYMGRLARALASIINVFDPDVIVLGGGLSNIDALYTQVPTLWSQWVFSDEHETKLVQNRFGDSSGVRGAAWLWPEPSVG